MDPEFTQSYVYLADTSKLMLGKAGNGDQYVYLSGQGANEYLGEVGPAGAKAYAADHLGSILNSAVAGNAHAYGAFGEVLGDAPSLAPSSNPAVIAYAGGLYNPENGTTTFGVRELNHQTARWLTKDPIGFASGDTNLYRYVRNNPLSYVDPSGLFNIVVGGGGSATAISDGEASGGVFVNPGFFGQQPAAGVFGTAGASAGLNVSGDVFVGVILGGAENISGTTVNANLGLDPVSISTFFDPKTGGFVGGTIGFGPSATPIGVSTSITNTGTAFGFGGPTQQPNACAR